MNHALHLLLYFLTVVSLLAILSINRCQWKIKHQDEEFMLGCLQLNPLKEVTRVPFCNVDMDGQNHLESDEDSDAEMCDKMDGVKKNTEKNVPIAFELDSTCATGHVALYYPPSNYMEPQVWFQDLSGVWHFMANTFTDYFRLMIMHLGLPNWQYAFTDVGLDPVSQQVFKQLFVFTSKCHIFLSLSLSIYCTHFHFTLIFLRISSGSASCLLRALPLI